MALFFFQSLKEIRAVAITEDQTGGNLPAQLAPWRAMVRQTIPPALTAEIELALQNQGYYIVHAGNVFGQ